MFISRSHGAFQQTQQTEQKHNKIKFLTEKFTFQNTLKDSNLTGTKKSE